MFSLKTFVTIYLAIWIYIIKTWLEDALDYLGNGRMRKSFSPWKRIFKIKSLFSYYIQVSNRDWLHPTIIVLMLPFGWYKWVPSGNVPPVAVTLQIFVGQYRIRYLQHALESVYFFLELLTIRNSHQPFWKQENFYQLISKCFNFYRIWN